MCLNTVSIHICQIYVELDVRYHPVQGAAGDWTSEDFLKVEDSDEYVTSIYPSSICIYPIYRSIKVCL